MSNALRGTIVNPIVIRGKSAYEIAVKHGFDGTEEEWLASLAEDATKKAEEYANEAEASAEEAKTARDKALASEESAQASARAAGESANVASNHEGAALVYANRALDSKALAETSETNAKTSEINAKVSEENAKVSEENAKVAEQSAIESATRAAESATTAHEAGYNAAADAISDLKISWNEEKASAIEEIEAAKANMIAEVEAEIADEKRSMLEEIELAAEIVQTTGNSETAVMSQKATTAELGKISEEMGAAFDNKNLTSNILPNDTESGYYTVDGLKGDSTEWVRTPNAIKIPNGVRTLYVCAREALVGRLVCLQYTDDAEESFIANTTKIILDSAQKGTIALRTNAEYVRFYLSSGYTFNDISVSVTDGEFEEYSVCKVLKESALPTELYGTIDEFEKEVADVKVALNEEIARVDSAFEDKTLTNNILPNDTESGYYTVDGLKSDSTEWVRTPNAIKVPDGVKTLYVCAREALNGRLVALQYEDETEESFITNTTNVIIDSAQKGTIALRNNAKYVRFYLASAYTFDDISVSVTDGEFEEYAGAKVLKESAVPAELYEKTMKLYGKKIANFGDSIFGIKQAPDDISTKLAEITGATVYNLGFGGCRMAEHTQNWDAFSMYRLADAIATNDYSLQTSVDISATGLPWYFEDTRSLLTSIDWNDIDIITIGYGTNDFMANVLLDSDSDSKNVGTFAGALRYSIEKILGAYPHIKIFICGQTYRFFMDSSHVFTDDSDTRENNNGVKLTDFVEKTADVAGEYHLKFIDNYYELGINKFNRSHWFPPTDGTHHNSLGSKLIAEHMANELY